MLTIEQATIWRTKDGEPHQTHRAAVVHAVRLELTELLRGDDELYWRDIGPDQIGHFLVDHADEVLALLKELPDESA